MIDISEILNVSRETIVNLKTYHDMVLEKNEQFNLIGKSTKDNIWERHIIDSLQLYTFINKEDETLYDFGSGAGFPGVVLAIIAKEKNPRLKINLVESITKKSNFLNEVKKTLNLNIEVINNRIENLKQTKADIITSRALASLSKLLEYSYPFCKSNTKLVFPKGEKWFEEIEEAKKHWDIAYKLNKSITNEKACIIYIDKIRRKK